MPTTIMAPPETIHETLWNAVANRCPHQLAQRHTTALTVCPRACARRYRAALDLWRSEGSPRLQEGDVARLLVMVPSFHQ